MFNQIIATMVAVMISINTSAAVNTLEEKICENREIDVTWVYDWDEVVGSEVEAYIDELKASGDLVEMLDISMHTVNHKDCVGVTYIDSGNVNCTHYFYSYN